MKPIDQVMSGSVWQLPSSCVQLSNSPGVLCMFSLSLKYWRISAIREIFLPK
jgi:hypothetical protein